jgi:hypothetical protein
MRTINLLVRARHETPTHVLSDSLHLEYSGYYIEVKTQLSNLYVKYESKFGFVRLQRPQPASTGPANVLSSWNRFMRTNPSSSPPSISTGPIFNTHISCIISKLSSYLDSDPLTEFDESSSVLSWWRDHKRTYPILSILAKDVLIVPRSLTPEHVEMLSLTKDWEQAVMRQQHSVENKDQELMANMYLDAEEVSSVCGSGGYGNAVNH